MQSSIVGLNETDATTGVSTAQVRGRTLCLRKRIEPSKVPLPIDAIVRAFRCDRCVGGALAHSTSNPIVRLRLHGASVLLLLFLCAARSVAGGIDHLVEFDDSGIWKRSNQTALVNLLIGGEIVGALWEGGDTR